MSVSHMGPITVDIEEFREHLGLYLHGTSGPVAITCNGKTLGYFTPVRRRPTEAELAALDEAKARLDAELAGLGLTEEELVEDFKRWRAEKRK